MLFQDVMNQCDQLIKIYSSMPFISSAHIIVECLKDFQKLPWQRCDEFLEDFSSDEIMDQKWGSEALHAWIFNWFAHIIFPMNNYIRAINNIDDIAGKIVCLLEIKELHHSLQKLLICSAEALVEFLMCAFDVSLNFAFVIEAGFVKQKFIQGEKFTKFIETSVEFSNSIENLIKQIFLVY